eukprot:6202760-Pyramimonas_sp.AAC.1
MPGRQTSPPTALCANYPYVCIRRAGAAHLGGRVLRAEPHDADAGEQRLPRGHVRLQEGERGRLLWPVTLARSEVRLRALQK